MILMMTHVLLIYSKQILAQLSEDLFCSAILQCTVLHIGFKSRQLWVGRRPRAGGLHVGNRRCCIPEILLGRDAR